MDSSAGVTPPVIPTVDPADMKTMWVGMRNFLKRLPPGTEVGGEQSVPGQSIRSIGIDPSAFFGQERAQEVDLLNVTRRYWLLDALVERGVLKAYQQDDSLTDAVFRVAAMMPLSNDDLAEAMILLQLSKEKDPALVLKGKDELRQAGKKEGYDPDHPWIDVKFLTRLKNSYRP